MKNRMKNQLEMLALAGLILAVLASGTAFATGGTYTGTLESTYSGGGSITWNQYASGGIGPVVVGDTISWINRLNNNAGHEVTGYVGGMTDPAGLDGTGGITIYQDSSVISGVYGSSWSVLHSPQIIKTGSHSILAYHSYKDGDSYYTRSDQGHMSYY